VNGEQQEVSLTEEELHDTFLPLSAAIAARAAANAKLGRCRDPLIRESRPLSRDPLRNLDRGVNLDLLKVCGVEVVIMQQDARVAKGHVSPALGRHRRARRGQRQAGQVRHFLAF